MNQRDYFKDATHDELALIETLLPKLSGEDLEVLEKWVDGKLGFHNGLSVTGTQWFIGYLKERVLLFLRVHPPFLLRRPQRQRLDLKRQRPVQLRGVSVTKQPF